MKPAKQLVEITKLQMKVNDASLIGCALAWHQGKGYAKYIFEEDILIEMENWDNNMGISEFVTDFCLDYMSGRIPPNQLVNALQKISENCKNTNAKRKGGKK